MQTIALVDYGCGNIPSASKALIRAADLAGRDIRLDVTDDPDAVAAADRIVLPGVGHFRDCAQALAARTGLVDALEAAVLRRAIPFLGICVGMQLLATQGHEDGQTDGLDWIPGTVEKLSGAGGQRIPHMGWNALQAGGAPSPLQEGLGDAPYFYFVHSYRFKPAEGSGSTTLATTEYGETFPAIIGSDNIVGTQFHPEKSQHAGLRLLRNWITWSP